MRRHVLFVAEAWVKQKEEKECFLIYLKPRAENERAETVVVKNSDLEMEGSGIDLVMVPKTMRLDRLEKMEQVLKMKVSSPLLHSYSLADKMWCLDKYCGSISGESRLTPDPKKR